MLKQKELKVAASVAILYLILSIDHNQTNNFECCNLRSKNAASFANNKYTASLHRCLCFATLCFIFSYTQGVPKNDFLMTGQVPAESLFFIIQACSMRKIMV